MQTVQVQLPPFNQPLDLEIHPRVHDPVQVPVRVLERQGVGIDEVRGDEQVDLGGEEHECEGCVGRGVRGDGCEGREGARPSVVLCGLGAGLSTVRCSWCCCGLRRRVLIVHVRCMSERDIDIEVQINKVEG